jgi:ketosteroid isomerase-like protein
VDGGEGGSGLHDPRRSRRDPGPYTQWAETFEDIEFEGREMIDAGDRVFAWIRISGRGAVSGIPVEMEQAQVWMFRDGKVVRVEEYFDRAEGVRAAGLPES